MERQDVINTQGRYIVHSNAERQKMLESMGMAAMDDLYKHVPQHVRLSGLLQLPTALSDPELEAHIRALAGNNQTLYTYQSFLGAGVYEHHVPAVVDAIAERGEFLTAYTPYQPEMSQGLLQVLAEYQEYISALVALPVVNCSCYDGSTALADAIWMSCQNKSTGDRVIVLSDTIWAQTQKIVETYFTGRPVKLVTIPADDDNGLIDLSHLEKLFIETAPESFAFQSPNCYGLLEDTQSIVELCKKYNVTSILHYHPFLSGLFVPPGQLGVDIVCGEGQMLGIPLSGGGASLGYLACTEPFKRFLPGRLVGVVEDIFGNPAYALVNEEREQHVARERATSNICSNQALCALRATVYIASLGNTGLQNLARLNADRAHFFCRLLESIDGVERVYKAAFFNEFVIKLPCASDALLSALLEQKIYGGVALTRNGVDNNLLIAVTEVKSRADLVKAATAFRVAIELLVKGEP
ncbi:putative glycine dehydrogenase subunit 1 [Pseudomonas caricapapayae]|uniref:Putative glycine dehydrogenase subunit 1 n=1 Tax=Pseudomonas caricapapayae TaxID=46678 RepID=A0A3M6EM00_9PSED|nr:putative glycine dehydrogenase subunit 1 [Pseudomonas caricapapayae]